MLQTAVPTVLGFYKTTADDSTVQPVFFIIDIRSYGQAPRSQVDLDPLDSVNVDLDGSLSR